MEHFHPLVARWFRATFSQPTEAQRGAWQSIARRTNTLLLAPTGSGKTLAAFLMTIDRLAFPDRPPILPSVNTLYISPLKALGVDIARNLRAPLDGLQALAEREGHPFREPTVGVRSGDTPASERARLRRLPPDILITTPESLFLMLTSRARSALAGVETVIIDEIHAMAATKRGAHLFVSLERLEGLRRLMNPNLHPLQRIGLSATQRPLEEIARLLGGAEIVDGIVRPRPVEIVASSTRRALSLSIETPLADLLRPPPAPDAPKSGETTKTATTLAKSDAATPGASSSSPPESDMIAPSLWPALYPRLVSLIRAHRGTLVFVNSRRLAERIAAAVNENAGEELALAHHGSLSREIRTEIEERLKAGELPALIATSSLELGIDVGSIDLVVQIESPPSIAAGLQRIGRASHHVGGVPAGIVFPKYLGDSLACAAAAARMLEGAVEESYYPRNPLDVLAQQVVAMVASRSETVDALYDTVRRAAPFNDLPRASFLGVLEMLAGRYPSQRFSELKPRVVWDPVTNRVSPRQGAFQVAVANAGTIPDRGMYGVFLAENGAIASAGDSPDANAPHANAPSANSPSANSPTANSSSADSSYANSSYANSPPAQDSVINAPAAADAKAGRGNSSRPGRRVGELDEEMVYETKIGEVFLLGVSSWRVVDITADRVMVAPAPGQPGRMPFWRSDSAGRPLEFGLAIGELTRTLLAERPVDAARRLTKHHTLKPSAAKALVAYVRRQAAATGAVPSDETVLIECFRDESGGWRVALMAPFGARIFAPWATVVLTRLRQDVSPAADAVWSNDGIVFRLPASELPPSVEQFMPRSDEVESVLVRELASTPVFAARFRENAGRALLLPRRMGIRRTPLWLQRRRAADLLAAVAQFTDFPILLETYREILRDVFDLPALRRVLEAIEQRRISVLRVETRTPSPFANSLLFDFVGNFMYGGDTPLAERQAQALLLDQSQLRQLLGGAEPRDLLDPEVVAATDRELQRLDGRYPPRHADDLHDLLRRLGDLDSEEIAARCAPDDREAGRIDTWLRELAATQRVARAFLGGADRWIAAEDAASYRDALGAIIEPSIPLRPSVALLPSVTLGVDAASVASHDPWTRLGPAKSALVDPLGELLERFARTRGPFTAMAVADRFGIGVSMAIDKLRQLEMRGAVVSGWFTPLAATSAALDDQEWADQEPAHGKTVARTSATAGERAGGGASPSVGEQARAKASGTAGGTASGTASGTAGGTVGELASGQGGGKAPESSSGKAADSEWCGTEVARLLRQRSLMRARAKVAPVDQAAFTRFRLGWHGLNQPRRGRDGLLDVVEQLQGLPLPLATWENEVWPARVADFDAGMLDELCAAGEVVWRGVSMGVSSRGNRVAFFLPDDAPRLAFPPTPLEGDEFDRLRTLLRERGALFFDAVTRTLGGPPQDWLNRLWELVWNGEVTNDTLAPLRSFALNPDVSWSRREGRYDELYRSRRPARLPGSEGRWWLFERGWGPAISATERHTAWATLLLKRHGVVTREAVMAEDLPGGYAALYPVLKAFEEAGRVHRGYFVADLGASQFAALGADQRLRLAADRGPPAIVLAALDPANPFGSALPFPAAEHGARLQRVEGAKVVVRGGRMVAYLSRGGQALWTFTRQDEPSQLEDCRAVAQALAQIASPSSPLFLTTVNGVLPAPSPMDRQLIEAGFTATSQGYLHR